jgi:hypothetical protein
VDASDRKIRKPQHFTDSGHPFTEIWSCWQEPFSFMDGVDTGS